MSELPARTLYIKGTGYDIGGDEVSEEIFDELREADESDYGSILYGDDFDVDIDDSGPEFPPILVLHNNETGEEECLNGEKTLEELGVKIEGDYPIVNNKEVDSTGSNVDSDYNQFVTKIEKLKGIWGKFDIKEGEKFDLSKIIIDVEKHTLGKNDYQKTIHTCRVFYDDMDMNEDVVETRGISIDYFLE